MKTLHMMLCASLLFTALEVSLSINPVHSVLYLVLTFCQAGAILIVFNTDFFGIISVVIYVGAIAILFLFVIMMLSIKSQQSQNYKNVAIVKHFEEYRILYLITFVYMIGNFLYSVVKTFFQNDFEIFYNSNLIFDFKNVDSFNNIDVLGQVLYNYYSICFLVGGIILLIALLGCIVLTLKFSEIKKNQLSNRQLARSDKFLSFFIDKKDN